MMAHDRLRDFSQVGDRVEARFRGRAKYFSGRILKAHADGSFDIEYDDGDKEYNVAAALVRPPPCAHAAEFCSDDEDDDDDNG
jgi:hypothetical protein